MAYVRAPKEVDERYKEDSPSEALTMLRSERGPHRFAKVAPGVYRGGQPTAEHLAALKAIGVKAVISLRREDRDLREAEEAEAVRLGLKFYAFPFYGVFGADDLFLRGILEKMKDGNVYIHCKRGRDRTSLLVALYRVMIQGWDPKTAWKLEVLDYGYQPTWQYRALGNSFDKMVRTYVKPDAPPVPKPDHPTGEQDKVVGKEESPQEKKIEADDNARVRATATE